LIGLPFFPSISTPSYGIHGFREDDLFWNYEFNSAIDEQMVVNTVAKEMVDNVNYAVIILYTIYWFINK
jgi:hypothetical protein